MKHRAIAFLPLVLALAAALAAPALAADEPLPSQTSIGELVTITGEVVALDPEKRWVSVRGPLGGEVGGRVQDDVKNLDQVKVGDLLTIAYFQSVAISATRQGEANPLFTGGEAATAAAGERPAGYASAQVKRTVTVVSVDAERRSIVFQGEDGTLFPVEVQRPEFAHKLQGLRAGDRLDVVLTEALIAEVTPAAPGAKPSITREVGTLIVDRGEVVRRVNNTLFIRNEKGRTVRVTVDPAFKFVLDGREVTVAELQPGTRLSRTAFRIVESTTIEGE